MKKLKKKPEQHNLAMLLVLMLHISSTRGHFSTSPVATRVSCV